MKTRFWRASILGWLMLASLSFGATQPTNSPAAKDFSAFKIIPEKNIFNPRRYARSGQAPQETRSVARTDSISLVGIMSYEKGPFAFFEGTRAEYRKVLKRGDSIAGYKLTNIAPNSATLSTTTNQLELRVGMRLRREENGAWQMGSSSEETSTTSGSTSRTTGRPTSAARVSRITTAPAAAATTAATKSDASDAPAPAQPEAVVEDAPPPEAVTTNAEPAAASESTETDPVLRRLIERRNQELNR
jgi:hypothetical protein